jgi:hypothetical protein
MVPVFCPLPGIPCVGIPWDSLIHGLPGGRLGWVLHTANLNFFSKAPLAPSFFWDMGASVLCCTSSAAHGVPSTWALFPSGHASLPFGLSENAQSLPTPAGILLRGNEGILSHTGFTTLAKAGWT